MSGDHQSIGEVLATLRGDFPDITISKIRFLESQGLIDPERTPSGYRKFRDGDVARLRWILHQQKDNFLPLKVIKARLDEVGPDGLPADVEPGEPEAVARRARARAAPRPRSRRRAPRATKAKKPAGARSGGAHRGEGRDARPAAAPPSASERRTARVRATDAAARRRRRRRPRRRDLGREPHACRARGRLRTHRACSSPSSRSTD